MAFDIKGLGKVGNQSRRGASPQKYAYRTADTLATVVGNNYFAPIASMLEVGDEIEVQHVKSLADSPANITGKNVVRIGAKVPGMIIAASEKGVALLTDVITDISTASFAEMTVNVAGDIDGITTVLGGNITTANDTISFTIGGVAVTNGNITVAAPGAVGDVDTSTPTAAKTLAVGNALRATTSGNSDGTAPLYIIYKVTLA